MKHDPYIKKFAFKDGLPQEFELVELGKLFKEHSDSLTIPHRTGFYHVLWFQKGTPTHMMDFETITIEPNTLLFLNKDTVQQFDKNEKIAGKALLFTESFFCRSVPDTKFLRSTILFNDLFSISKIKLPSDDSVVPSIIDHIRKELEKAKDDFQSTILHNLLHNLLLHCERERRKQDFTEIKQSVDLDIVMLFREELDIHYIKKSHIMLISLGLRLKGSTGLHHVFWTNPPNPLLMTGSYWNPNDSWHIPPPVSRK